MCTTFTPPNAHLTPLERSVRDKRPADLAIRLGNYAKALLLRIFLFRGCRVLELGCGTGSNILKFEASGASHVTFVDNDRAKIDETIRRLRNRTHLPGALRSYDTIVFDFTADFSAEFGTGNFDFVLTMYSLQYAAKNMPSLPLFFRRCLLSLKNGGLFVAILPNYQRLCRALVAERPGPGAGPGVPVERLFTVKAGPEFHSGKSGAPYLFQVHGQEAFSEYTLLVPDLLEASSRYFSPYFVGPISEFADKYTDEYPCLAQSLSTFILKPGRALDSSSADFDLYNLYDVVILRANHNLK